MRKYLVPAILTSVMLSSGLAMAAEATGVVKTWDLKTHTLMLQDGKAYILPASFVKADAFTTGKKVTIYFDMKAGQNVATSAEKAS